MKIELLEKNDRTKSKSTKSYEARYTVGRKVLELDIQVRDDKYTDLKMIKNPEKSTTEEVITLKNGKPESYALIGTLGNSWDLNPNDQEDKKAIQEFKKAFQHLRKVDDFMKRHPEYFKGLF